VTQLLRDSSGVAGTKKPPLFGAVFF